MHSQRNAPAWISGSYSQTELDLALGDLSVAVLRRVLGRTAPNDFHWYVMIGAGEIVVAYYRIGYEMHQPDVRGASFGEVLGKWREISWSYERWRAESQVATGGRS